MDKQILRKSIDFFKKSTYTMDRIIKHLCVFVRAALRRRSIFLLYRKVLALGLLDMKRARKLAGTTSKR